MATQPLFKDIGKRVSDLLTKDFPSEKQEVKVEWKSTSSTGVKNEVTIKSETNKGETKTVGTLKNEYLYKPQNTTFTFEANTDRELKLEASAADKLVNGLKTIFTLQSQSKKGLQEFYETLGVEYRHELVSGTVSAEVGRSTDNALKASVVVGTGNVAVGTSAEYVRRDSSTDLKELKSSVSYCSDEFDAVAYGKVTGREPSRKTEVGATYYHKISSDLSVGTEIKFDVSNKGAEPKMPTLAFGSIFNVATGPVKAKFDTAGQVGLSTSQQLSKNTKVLLSGTLNANDLSGKDSVKFGLHLNFSG